MKNKNYLFVDGRYTIQGNYQSGKFFNIVTIPRKMPKDILKNKNLLIGFDPKLFTKKSLNVFFGKRCKFRPLANNLIDKIWKRKIKKLNHSFYKLPDNCVGESYKTKLKKITFFLKKHNADFQLITASENSAWLLNIRGNDADYTPIPYCYILISKNKNIKFFCDLKKIPFSFKKHFNNLEFVDKDKLDKTLSKISGKKFIIDRSTCSFYYENIINKKNKLLNLEDPIYLLKAIKNKKELENIKQAHIYDGAALTKFLFWLKKNFNKKKITEISASKKLYDFRKKIKILNF